MQKINQVLEASSQTTTTQVGPTVSQTRSDLGDGGKLFINKLFTSLQAIFPAWRQAFPDDSAIAEAKRQWTMGIMEAGLTNADAIKAGLAKARKSKNPFIPSVGMFIDWCAEAARERLNFPTLDSVIAQIARYSHNRKYPDPKCVPDIHPVAYWVYQHVDAYALRHADEREARRITGIAYAEASEKAAQGYEFPAPPLMVQEGVGAGAPSTPEQAAAAKEARDRVRNMFRSH